MVTIKSIYNSKYVCAENAGNSSLVANREIPNKWETFEVAFNVHSFTFGLRSVINNKYVSAANASQDYLIANTATVGQWETFVIASGVNEKSYAIKLVKNGNYVSVTDNGQLIANASSVGNRESFLIVPNWKTLKSIYNNKYVCAENAGNSELIANRENAFEWETFQMLYNDDGTVSFNSRANFKYVCAENAAQSYLIANRTAIGSWEKFYLTNTLSANIYGLRSYVNDLYVSVTDNGQLIANASSIGDRESFLILTL